MLRSGSEGENPRTVPPREVFRVLPQKELFPEELMPFYCPYCREDIYLKFGEVPSCIVDFGHFLFKKKKICPALVDRYSAFPRHTGKTQLVVNISVSYYRRSNEVGFGLGIVLRDKSLNFIWGFSCYKNKSAIVNSKELRGLIAAIELVKGYRDSLPPNHELNNVIFYMSSKNAVEAFNGIDPHQIDLKWINEARREAGLTEFHWNGVSNKMVEVGISQPLFRSLSVKYIPRECNQIADQLSLIKSGSDGCGYTRVEQIPTHLHLKMYELLWHDIFVIHQLEKNLQGMPTPNNWQHEPTSEGGDQIVGATKLGHRLKGNMNQQVKVEGKKWTPQDWGLIPIRMQAARCLVRVAE